MVMLMIINVPLLCRCIETLFNLVTQANTKIEDLVTRFSLVNPRMLLEWLCTVSVSCVSNFLVDFYIYVR